MDFSKKALACPCHPRETVTRVALDANAKKTVFCIECLMELGSFDKQHIVTISDFLDIASNFYIKLGQNVKKSDDQSAKYSKTMDQKFEKLGELANHLQNEKTRVSKEFDFVIEEFRKVMETKRDKFLDLLDQQLITFQNNYLYFEKQINKASGCGEYPDRQILFERINSCSSPQQFVACIKEIKEDMNDNRAISESSDLLARINQQLLQNIRRIPEMATPKTFKFDPIRDAFDKSLDVILGKMFQIRDEIESVTKPSYPESKILERESFELLKIWAPVDLQHKKFNLLFQYSKDKTVQELTKKVFGRENLYVVFKNSNNKVFGGFMPYDFGRYNGYFSCPGAYLFSLENSEKFEAKFTGNQGWTDTNSCGICFGGDMYLTLSNGYGVTNSNPQAYTYKDVNALGGTSWTCTEMEVYTFE